MYNIIINLYVPIAHAYRKYELILYTTVRHEPNAGLFGKSCNFYNCLIIYEVDLFLIFESIFQFHLNCLLKREENSVSALSKYK